MEIGSRHHHGHLQRVHLRWRLAAPMRRWPPTGRFLSEVVSWLNVQRFGEPQKHKDMGRYGMIWVNGIGIFRLCREKRRSSGSHIWWYSYIHNWDTVMIYALKPALFWGHGRFGISSSSRVPHSTSPSHRPKEGEPDDRVVDHLSVLDSVHYTQWWASQYSYVFIDHICIQEV